MLQPMAIKGNGLGFNFAGLRPSAHGFAGSGLPPRRNRVARKRGRLRARGAGGMGNPNGIVLYHFQLPNK